MFTIAQRDALRERMLRLAQDDARVVAGAVVGSLAVDAGDRFSDLDLTFGIADDVPVTAVLDDWTGTLADELAAVEVADLERGPTVYRVFLLPEALHVGALSPDPLRAALAAATAALMHEGAAAGLPNATVVADRVGKLQ